LQERDNSAAAESGEIQISVIRSLTHLIKEEETAKGHISQTQSISIVIIQSQGLIS